MRAVHSIFYTSKDVLESDITFSFQETGLNISAYLENCEVSSSRSATLPRNHRRQLSSDITIGTPCMGSRENSPIARYPSSYASSTLPRKHAYRCRDGLRKSSRTSLSKPQTSKTEETSFEIKPSEGADSNSPGHNSPKQHETLNSADSTKTSHRFTTNFSYEEPAGSSTDSPVKNLSSIDNSGPSSIESHKSSKTGSSLTSGPSSLESHKTVINRNLPESPKIAESKNIKKHIRKVSSAKNKGTPLSTPSPVVPMSHSNSFTLQVTTNQNGVNINNKTNATTTATINGGAGSNTKIFVQNSPVRSVITFENGQPENNHNVIVIGDGVEHPSSEENCEVKPAKNTNQSKESHTSLNNSKDVLTNFESTINNESKCEAMNNNRKLSLQLPSRESLSYHNLIKNVSSSSHNQYNSTSNPDSPIANTFRECSKNSVFTSTPSSPTKSYEGIPMLSSGKYIKNEVGSKTSLEKSFYGLENGKALDKNVIGSEPNICYKERTLTRENSNHQFPSLSDLSFNFTSLAAQKILKGVSINSVDTLVELNMAANVEKQNNCDVVHTDFGLF